MTADLSPETFESYVKWETKTEIIGGFYELHFSWKILSIFLGLKMVKLWGILVVRPGLYYKVTINVSLCDIGIETE